MRQARKDALGVVLPLSEVELLLALIPELLRLSIGEIKTSLRPRTGQDVAHSKIVQSGPGERRATY
jgi:hypothetical protein